MTPSQTNPAVVAEGGEAPQAQQSIQMQPVASKPMSKYRVSNTYDLDTDIMRRRKIPSAHILRRRNPPLAFVAGTAIRVLAGSASSSHVRYHATAASSRYPARAAEDIGFGAGEGLGSARFRIMNAAWFFVEVDTWFNHDMALHLLLRVVSVRPVCISSVRARCS